MALIFRLSGTGCSRHRSVCHPIWASSYPLCRFFTSFCIVIYNINNSISFLSYWMRYFKLFLSFASFLLLFFLSNTCWFNHSRQCRSEDVHFLQHPFQKTHQLSSRHLQSCNLGLLPAGRTFLHRNLVWLFLVFLRFGPR